MWYHNFYIVSLNHISSGHSTHNYKNVDDDDNNKIIIIIGTRSNITFGKDRYVFSLNGSNSFIDLSCSQTYSNIHIKFIHSNINKLC